MKTIIDHQSFKIREGDFVIATDECVMHDTEIGTLTIGKSYKVISVNVRSDEFAIIDDEGDEHLFELSKPQRFFSKRISENN